MSKLSPCLTLAIFVASLQCSAGNTCSGLLGTAVLAAENGDRAGSKPSSSSSSSKSQHVGKAIATGSSATSLDRLGAKYLDAHRFSEAETVLKRSLSIREKSRQVDSAAIAAVLNLLGRTYMAEKRYDLAEQSFVRALNSATAPSKAGGPRTLGKANALHNLGGLYFLQGKLTKSEEYYRRALAEKEKLLGLEAPEVALSMRNLAIVFRFSKRYAEAEALLKRALEIQQKIYGPNNRILASTLSNLAYVYISTQEPEKAEGLCKRAVTILEQTSNGPSTVLATALYNLAVCNYHTRKYKEAELALKKALQISESELSKDDYAVGEASELMSLVLLRLHRNNEAYKYNYRAKVIYSANHYRKPASSILALPED